MSQNELLTYLFEKHGAFGQSIAAEDALLTSMRGRLPELLLQLWQGQGIGSWLDGYFQFCDPRRFSGLVQAVLGEDPDFPAARTHLLGWWGMGKLLLWNEDHRTIAVNLLTGHVTASHFFKPQPGVDDDTAMGGALVFINDPAHDAADNDANYMFERLRKHHGPIGLGQVFAPRLHPALGGARVVDSFRPVAALEAFGLMAQAVPFTLVNLSNLPPVEVRPIG